MMNTKTSRLSVPMLQHDNEHDINRHSSEPPRTFCTINVGGPDLLMVSGWTEAKARDAAREELLLKARIGMGYGEHGGTIRTIACTDGTVLVVRWICDGVWGYMIHGPGRDGFGGTSGQMTYAECVARARDHATQSYRGIVWESGSPVPLK